MQNHPQNQQTIASDLNYLSWQDALRDCVTDIDALCEYLELSNEFKSSHCLAESNFPLRVPRQFLSKISKGDPNDPLLLQVLPLQQEILQSLYYQADPVNDLAHNPVAGIVHKYKHRALLTLTGSCAIHCRYCFRREFPYAEQNALKGHARDAIEYLANNSNIHEVILSGGDPLSLSDSKLGLLFKDFDKIKHIKTIRIHTRFPIVIPQRLSNCFIKLLAKSSKKIVLVLHANHPNELDQNLKHACQNLREIGVTILNQSVLLRNINDTEETLTALSTKLFDYGILPYYLNLFDKVRGGQHFDIPIEEAKTIYSKIRANLPGYLVPKLVRDDGNNIAKTLLV